MCTCGQCLDVLCISESGGCCKFVPLFFHFSFSPISRLKFFFTLFLGTMRPRRLIIGTHLDSGQMYHVYRTQVAATYSSLYFFIFFSHQFSTLKFFVTLYSGTVRPRELKIDILVDSGQMYCVKQNQAAAAYLSLHFFIFLSLQFSNIKIFRHTFLRNRRLKLDSHVEKGRCIMCTGIRMLLLICLFISSFFFLSNYQK